MKRFAIAIGLLSVIFPVVVCSYYLFLFDPNIFKPQLEKYFQHQWGIHLKLGTCSHHGLASFSFDINGIILRNGSDNAWLLKAERAIFSVHLSSLWKNRLILRSVEIIKPIIYIRQDQNTRWHWPFQRALLNPSAEASYGEKFQSDTPADIVINDAQIHWQDPSQNPPFDLDLNHCFTTAFFSPKNQNLALEFSATVTDGFNSKLRLNVSHDRNQDALIFECQYAQKLLEIKGKIKNVSKEPHLKCSVDIHSLDLGTRIPNRFKKRNPFTGTLTAHFDAAIRKADRKPNLKNARFRGVVDIRKGSLTSTNLITDILETVTPVRDAGFLTTMQYPEDLEPVIRSSGTPFEALQTNFKIEDGKFYAEETILKHPAYLMVARGRYGLVSGEIDFNAQLILLERFTQYLTQRLHKLETLRNRQGRIVVPFFYQGVFPENVLVKPEFGYNHAKE